MNWLDVIMNNTASVMSTMPPQTQKNLWGAFGRLTSAIVDLPVGRIQGKRQLEDARRNVELAKINAEASAIRTEQDLINKFNKEAVKAASSVLSKDKNAQRVFAGVLSRGFISQSREERTLRLTVQDIIDNPPQEDAKSKIDEDVVDAVLRKSSQRGDEEIRLLFAKILAGEIKSPGSFSLRTISTLDTLDKPTLDMFLKACSISSDGPTSGKIIADPYGNAGNNGLAKFELSYSQLSDLSDAGLINVDLNSWQEIPEIWFNFSLPFKIGPNTYRLHRRGAAQANENFRVSGPSLSRIGRELKVIAPMVSDVDYITGLSQWLSSKGIDLIPVS